MADARTWLAAHAGELTGTPVADAQARVQAAGLRPRVARPGSALTLAFVPDRVTLSVDGADVVTEVRPG